MQGATRILVIISRASSHWDTRRQPEAIEKAIFALAQSHEVLHLDPETCNIRFIAEERWDTRVFLIFDINNSHYESSTAHLPGQNDLSVIVVHLSKKETMYQASPQTRNKVNNDLRMLHKSSGIGSEPPFDVDHTDGNIPFYLNPRSGITSEMR